jgi:hypothetical protein
MEPGDPSAATRIPNRVVVKLSSSDRFDWTEGSVINATSQVVLKEVSGHVSSKG